MKSGLQHTFLAALAVITISFTGLAQTASIQVIHNSADLDPSVHALDVYIDSVLVGEGLQFAEATPYIEIPADQTVQIDFFPAGEPLGSIALWSNQLNLLPDAAAICVFSGLLNEGEFRHNPEGWYTFVAVRVKHQARTAALYPSTIDLTAFNGVTDAPSMNFKTMQGNMPVTDLSFGSFAEYFTVPASDFQIEAVKWDDPAVRYGVYATDLGAYAGKSGVVFASGFLEPSANKNGEPLALSIAFADGSIVPLSATTGVARVHAPAAAELSVYPSPVRTSASLHYTISAPENIALNIYDNLGRNVYSRTLGRQTAGSYSIPLETATLPAGVYRIAVQAGNRQSNKYFLVMR